jgi:transposase-like protein
MTQKRRKHSGAFKARVALEAVRGVKTINQIAAEHEIHPVQVSQWKKELETRMTEIFEKPQKADDKSKEREAERLESNCKSRPTICHDRQGRHPKRASPV